MAIELIWIKCTGNVWCDFHKLNLSHEHFDNLSGVYVIWSGKITVRVGSGVIRDRIADHRNDQHILAFPNLMVAWAQVNRNQMLGVEKYLSDILQPKVGERFPNVAPIIVNLPW